MRRLNTLHAAIAALCAAGWLPTHGQAAGHEKADLEAIVAQAVRPLMEHEGIPGMAVGIVSNGQRDIFNYGVASRATGKPVTSDTLFEVGSVSKTFTATLASYAQVGGRLSLADPASKHLPALRGSRFDEVSLLNLGTHTSGGLPLQVPDEVTNNEQLTGYFQHWKPRDSPGTYRTYCRSCATCRRAICTCRGRWGCGWPEITRRQCSIMQRSGRTPCACSRITELPVRPVASGSAKGQRIVNAAGRWSA